MRHFSNWVIQYHRIIRLDLICPCMHLSALLRPANRGPGSKDRPWKIAGCGRRRPFNVLGSIAEFSEAAVRGKRLREQGNGPVDSAADPPTSGEMALLRVRGNQLKQSVRCRASRKYGIISRRRGRWTRPGEREVQDYEVEDVERRTELYTPLAAPGWRWRTADARSGKARAARPCLDALNPR
ncbi:hypothetical protein N7523_000820 [Penicillium sp. IBT 18751x]|nr:hypothetical protein N7523_000820 [Penicillium sp. IBT 18751x]